jgi:hypothetical protein
MSAIPLCLSSARKITQSKVTASLCFAAALGFAALLFPASVRAEDPPTLQWIRQFGDTAQAMDVSADLLGNIFASGQLDERNGTNRWFLRTYDFGGNQKRSYELTEVGANQSINPQDVWADGLGSAYWVGGKGPSSITMDPFVYKFGPTGEVLWSHEFPFTGNASFRAVTGDGRGDVYLAGQKVGDEGFLYKLDSDGNIDWMRDFLVGNQGVADVATDVSGNIYVSGSTNTNLAGPNAGINDAFVLKFNASGDQLWARQFGGANLEFADGVATDREGNVFVAGERWLGDFNAPGGIFMNAYVRKYDSDGNFLWNREFGAGPQTNVEGFASDAHGNVYVSGYTEGSLAAPNAGESDVFLRKYDGAGNELWTYQFGSSRRDDFNSVWVDGVGNIFMAGMAGGNLAAPSIGSDAWIALLRDPSTVPEPTSVGLLVGMLALAGWRTRQSSAAR